MIASARVRIRPALAADREGWTALRIALWPDEPEVGLPEDTDCILASPERRVAFLALDETDAAIGFAEASLRADYVNGTQTSPVGFLEGWYVVPAWRRRGVGRALIAAVEEWVLQQGLSELASDALLDNCDSHAAHRAAGFEETERIVYFRKQLQSS